MTSGLAFTQLGSIARDCLVPVQRGKVLAVFSKAVYLVTGAEELFWIAADDSPMHRRCAATSSLPSGPLAGSPFRVEGHRLTIDPDFVFDIGGVPFWIAPRVDHALEITKLPARVDALLSNLDLSHVKGFGSLIPEIRSLSRRGSIDPLLEFSDPILRFAQPLVLNTARACLEHQPTLIAQYADALIGLGGGLTPSGDDFLGGFLFAAKTLQAVYPDSDFSYFAIPIDPYRSRTHLISFTLLNDHASGHAVAPLHEIINRLLTGASFESTLPFIVKLTQLGHSTGWDLLAGMLTALLITYHNADGRSLTSSARCV